MADPFLAQIVMFAGNFNPRGWANCDGQLLPISQNQAVFSLLGTTYGGDGRVTFALPDMRGRIPMHTGTGAGLNPRALGARGGAQTRVLTAGNLPPHTHTVACNSGVPDSDSPVAAFPSQNEGATEAYNFAATAGQSMNPGMIGGGGSSQAFDIMNPFLVVRFIIAIVGTFPS